MIHRQRLSERILRTPFHIGSEYHNLYLLFRSGRKELDLKRQDDGAQKVPAAACGKDMHLPYFIKIEYLHARVPDMKRMMLIPDQEVPERPHITIQFPFVHMTLPEPMHLAHFYVAGEIEILYCVGAVQEKRLKAVQHKEIIPD